MVIFSTAALSAGEAAVKQVITDFYQRSYELDGNGVLALFHPEFTCEDGDGKRDIATVRQACKEIDDMRNVIRPATAENATLLDVVQALFAMRGDELDSEAQKLAKELENTEEGKQMKAKAVNALKEMEKIYQQQIDAVRASLNIISVVVKDESAVISYTVKQQDETELWQMDMARKDGKWLIKKLKVSLSE